jgi:hypothetical protein
MNGQNDYQEFRGKCREMSEAAVRADPSLRLVRGHYVCPFWGQQAHWWAEKPDGTVVDPTARQFPSKGSGDYVEFDGCVACAECGKKMHEREVKYAEGRYAWCSYECQGRFIGVF